MRLDEYDKSAVKLANEAYGKVLKFHHNREIAAPKPKAPDGCLYHYTTADRSKGIIEKNELWATSAYFLNDSAEITYGCRVLKEALDEWIASNPRPEDSLTLGTARQLQTAFGEHFLNMHVVQPIYLACFCEEDNLLNSVENLRSIWRILLGLSGSSTRLPHRTRFQAGTMHIYIQVGEGRV